MRFGLLASFALVTSAVGAVGLTAAPAVASPGVAAAVTSTATSTSIATRLGHVALRPAYPVSLTVPGVPAGATGVRLRLDATGAHRVGVVRDSRGRTLLTVRPGAPTAGVVTAALRGGRVTVAATTSTGLTATAVGFVRGPLSPSAVLDPAALTVSAAAATAGPHRRTASISSQVRSASDLTPLAGVAVSAYDNYLFAPGDSLGLAYPAPVATATTAADGTYSLTGLPTGPTHHLTVCFDGSRVTGSATGYAFACQGPLEALAGGQTAALTRAALDPARAVAGTVVDPAGHPLAGVPVREDRFYGPGGLPVRTAADGTYTLRGVSDGDVCADGSVLGTAAAPHGYVPQCLVEPPSSGQTLVLPIGAEVVGTVTGSRGGTATPLGGVSVSVVQGHVVTTASDGSFRLEGAPASGVLCARAFGVTAGSDTGWLDECPLDGGSGVAYDGPGPVGIALSPAAALSGTVTSGSGAPLAGVQVGGASPADGGLFAATWTAADGTYRLTGLSAGSTQVCFAGSGVGPTGYQRVCRQSRLTAGRTTTRNAALTVGALVTGTVRDSSGQPVGGVEVAVSGASEEGGFTLTAPDGTYRLGGVGPGRATVYADALPGAGTSPTGYVDASTGPLRVRAGSVVRQDFVLVPGGAIVGQFVDAVSGAAVAGVEVDLEGPSSPGLPETDGDGAYRITGLAAGDYTVCGMTFSVTAPFPYGYLDDCADPVTVTVTSGVTTTAPAGALPRAGGITGRVVDAAGNGIGDVEVSAFTPDFDAGTSTTTAADGTFTAPGLQTGSYVVCFDPSSVGGAAAGEYVGRCYGKNPSGTPVTVVAGRGTALRPQVLQAAASITGTVTDATTGQPIAGVDVSSFDPSGGFADATTDADGRYLLTGLAPGSDTQVCFDSSQVTDPDVPDGYVFACQSTGQLRGGTTTLDVALAEAGAVSGTVTDEQGDPLSSVFASAIGPDGNGGPGTQTGTDGTYRLVGVAPGAGQVCFDGFSADQGSYGSTCVAVTVVANQETAAVDAVLSPAS